MARAAVSGSESCQADGRGRFTTQSSSHFFKQWALDFRLFVSTQQSSILTADVTTVASILISCHKLFQLTRCKLHTLVENTVLEQPWRRVLNGHMHDIMLEGSVLARDTAFSLLSLVSSNTIKSKNCNPTKQYCMKSFSAVEATLGYVADTVGELVLRPC